jgi:hypothetical protein
MSAQSTEPFVVKRHEILGRTLPYDELVAAVAQRAPHVHVTDRGRVAD